jgi:hypothetical protein
LAVDEFIITEILDIYGLHLSPALVETLASKLNLKSGGIGIDITHSQDTAVPCPYN